MSITASTRKRGTARSALSSPCEADIRAWCRACGANDQIPDLVATVRAIDSMYVEWQRQMRAGLKRSQAASVPLYERTKLFRGYENTVIPGLLHTAEYAAAIFAWRAGFLDLPNDVEEAVAARMERQKVLYTGDRRSCSSWRSRRYAHASATPTSCWGNSTAYLPT